MIDINEVRELDHLFSQSNYDKAFNFFPVTNFSDKSKKNLRQIDNLIEMANYFFLLEEAYADEFIFKL